MESKKSRNFVLKLWAETESYDFQTVYHALGKNYSYVGILHDSDSNVKSHWHFVIHAPYQVTAIAVATNLGLYGCPPNSFDLEPCLYKDKAYRYLIHAEHPDKFQYSSARIISNDNQVLAQCRNACSNASAFVDEASIVSHILENIENGNILSTIDLIKFCNSFGYLPIMKSYQFALSQAIKESRAQIE